MATASVANCLDELLQTGHESIITNPQQRTTGDIADPGGFDDEGCRSSFSKSAIPVQVVLGDESVFGRAPRHHRGNPRAVFKCQRTNLDRWKQKRSTCLISRRPACFGYLMFDRIGELPHGRFTLA